MYSDVFGVSRVMFGSDWPVCKLAQPQAGYAKTLHLLTSLTDHLNTDVFNTERGLDQELADSLESKIKFIFHHLALAMLLL